MGPHLLFVHTFNFYGVTDLSVVHEPNAINLTF